ncbi:MAG TPA: hypothetical protein VN787_07315 [Steroidobacteraceae bacterium]|nr:hypothetical protein [Steroidobacteraceae bacterium]
MLELLDKWLQSLELHLKYTALTDEAYWQVQPWGKHQRPVRWVLDLAQSRARELRRHLESRMASGDAGFAEALELMAFLANLVGAQNIERYIPLAEPERENPEVLGNTQSTLRPLTSGSTSTQSRALIEPTREMPMPVASVASTPVTAATAPTVEVPAVIAPPQAPSRPAKPVPPPAPTTAPAPSAARAAAKRDVRSGSGKHPKPVIPGSIDSQVIADAVRLMKWGREWHELAEAIARIAGRPGVVEVRKCLRTHKAEIERAARE